MKKKVLSIVLAAVMSLSMLTACSGADSAEDTSAEESAASEDTAEETTGERSTVSKIAVLLPGSITDESWNQTAYEGLQQIEAMGYETA